MSTTTTTSNNRIRLSGNLRVVSRPLNAEQVLREYMESRHPRNYGDIHIVVVSEKKEVNK